MILLSDAGVRQSITLSLPKKGTNFRWAQKTKTSLHLSDVSWKQPQPQRSNQSPRTLNCIKEFMSVTFGSCGSGFSSRLDTPFEPAWWCPNTHTHLHIYTHGDISQQHIPLTEMDGELPLWKSYLCLYTFCCLCSTFGCYIHNTTFHSGCVVLYYSCRISCLPFCFDCCVLAEISSVSVSSTISDMFPVEV